MYVFPCDEFLSFGRVSLHCINFIEASEKYVRGGSLSILLTNACVEDSWKQKQL